MGNYCIIGLTPRMVNYILTFARSGALNIHDEILPEVVINIRVFVNISSMLSGMK